MTLLLLLVGLLPPAILGWIVVRLAEGRHPVLLQAERIAFGVILGLTLSQYVTFLLQVFAHVPLSRWGFVFSYGLQLAAAVGGLIALKRRASFPVDVTLPASPSLSSAARAALIGLVAWSLFKIVTTGSLLFSVPAYYDDTRSNWNLRAKAYYLSHELQLTIPPETAPSGIASYPPTVPMVKTWLAALEGSWDEGLVNGVHIVWYVAVLVLAFCAIRRRASTAWAVIGTYALVSLPLYLIQGMNAYADVFLSAHVLAAVLPLWFAAETDDPLLARSHLRIAAVAIALLPFTKNEGLILFLPALAVALCITLTHLLRRRVLRLQDIGPAVSWVLGFTLIVAVPWIIFKLQHGLPFGNSHDISSFSISWHKDVPIAITINTFFEGNWLLLFPFLLVLLIACWKKAFRSPLNVLVLFFLLIYVVQLLLYLFTGLASEALMQTGYARGLVQLMPVILVFSTLLLRDFWLRARGEGER